MSKTNENVNTQVFYQSFFRATSIGYPIITNYEQISGPKKAEDVKVIKSLHFTTIKSL